MMDIVYILLSVLMLIGIFVLVYLKGRSVQMVFRGTGEALKEKKKRIDSINYLLSCNISEIDVDKGEEFHIRVCDNQAIKMFKRSLEKIEVCKLNKKNRQDGPTFEIYASGDKHVFESFFSPVYQEDMFVRLLDKYEKYYIKLPGLKRWLDENVSSKHKRESGR